MLYEEFIVKENKSTVFSTDKVQKLNQQLADNYNSKIEVLEKELLNLSDLLSIDGDLTELN